MADQGAHRDGAGRVSVAVVFAVGAVTGAVQMPAWAWVVSGLVAWVGAVVFAAFGLFIGYLVPSENVMQLLGPALALLALMGGIFVPLDPLSHTPADAREVHPGLRRRRARPAAAGRDGVDLGRGRQRRRLDGAVRRRRGLAVPPRHRPGLSAVTRSP